MTKMTPRVRVRPPGGISVDALNRMVPWEANLILNMRLWFAGPTGQAHVWNEYRRALPAEDAREACRRFETLLHKLGRSAFRRLLHRPVSCPCVGADEAVFAQPVALASDGELTDATLIAGLLVGPAEAERVALLAGEVGSIARHLQDTAVTSVAPDRIDRAIMH